MRKIEYLSHTSITLFYENPTEFYLQYLSDKRPSRLPQTKAMSVGSSFDAHCKSYLHEKLFGKDKDPKYALANLFEAQVEQHNRDWAWKHGAYVFNRYRESGALGDLLLELQNGVGEPRFEFEIKGVVDGKREPTTRALTKESGTVVLLGKPDVFYINKHGAHCILDWKVNNYLGKSNLAPAKGYIRLRGDCTENHPHKEAMPMLMKGMMINIGGYLEEVDETWAEQLSIYGWLCGEQVGEEFFICIDQIVCKPNNGSDVENHYPHIRVAEHRSRASARFQQEVWKKAQHVWDVVHSDHFFRDMSLSDSQGRCSLLDKQADVLADSPELAFMCRGQQEIGMYKRK